MYDIYGFSCFLSCAELCFFPFLPWTQADNLYPFEKTHVELNKKETKETKNLLWVYPFALNIVVLSFSDLSKVLTNQDDGANLLSFYFLFDEPYPK